MGQINDQLYELNGVTWGGKHDNPKKKTSRFKFKVDAANLHDGLFLILLYDRPLHLAVEYDGRDKPVEIGPCQVFGWSGIAANGTSSYEFLLPTIDWKPTVALQTEWDEDLKMTLKIVDKSAKAAQAARDAKEQKKEKQLTLDEIGL